MSAIGVMSKYGTPQEKPAQKRTLTQRNIELSIGVGGRLLICSSPILTFKTHRFSRVCLAKIHVTMFIH